MSTCPHLMQHHSVTAWKAFLGFYLPVQLTTLRVWYPSENNSPFHMSICPHLKQHHFVWLLERHSQIWIYESSWLLWKCDTLLKITALAICPLVHISSNTIWWLLERYSQDCICESSWLLWKCGIHLKIIALTISPLVHMSSIHKIEDCICVSRIYILIYWWNTNRN